MEGTRSVKERVNITAIWEKEKEKERQVRGKPKERESG